MSELDLKPRLLGVVDGMYDLYNLLNTEITSLKRDREQLLVTNGILERKVTLLSNGNELLKKHIELEKTHEELLSKYKELESKHETLESRLQSESPMDHVETITRVEAVSGTDAMMQKLAETLICALERVRSPGEANVNLSSAGLVGQEPASELSGNANMSLEIVGETDNTVSVNEVAVSLVNNSTHESERQGRQHLPSMDDEIEFSDFSCEESEMTEETDESDNVTSIERQQPEDDWTKHFKAMVTNGVCKCGVKRATGKALFSLGELSSYKRHVNCTDHKNYCAREQIVIPK
jgi:hypothetical protein